MADLLCGNRMQCQLGGSGHLCECLHCCGDFWVEGQCKTPRHTSASERIVRTDCVAVAFQHDDVALTLTHVHAHTHTLIRQAFRPCRKSKYSDANLVLRGVLTKQTGCGRTNLESLALHLLLLSWLWLWPSLAFSWVFYEVIWCRGVRFKAGMIFC